MDYYSRYPEVVSLTNTSSKKEIYKMKAIFARHGIPDEVRSDNGPQYASEIFAKFARVRLCAPTSSPRYPQSNGEAERMVQTMKKLLTKSDDPYQGLLSYRSAPLSNGYSPAELLMGRQLRGFVPATPATLLPNMSPTEINGSKNKFRDRRQKRDLTNNIEPRNYHHYLVEKECGFQTERKEGLFYNSLKHQDLIPSQHHPRNFEGTEDT